MKKLNFFYPLKKELLIILIGIILSSILAIKNLKEFDKVEYRSDNIPRHPMIATDMRNVWNLAEEFRKDLSENKGFFESLPIYDRTFLQPVLVGTYYHLINEKIIEKNSEGDLIIKTKNFKIGILMIQIFFYYLAVFFFISQFSKRFDSPNYSKILILSFLCLEPTTIQWISSFWSEGLFLSMLIFLLGCLISQSKSNFLKLLIGVTLGLMYAYKAILFIYIIPVIFFYLLINKKKMYPILFIISGFFLVTFFIGLNHYKKSGDFYIMSSKHQFHSYYQYFASEIYADRNNMSRKDAKIKLNTLEKEWRKKNNIIITDPVTNSNIEDLKKNIEYRNNFFLNEIKQNPLYFTKLFIKRIIVMCILHPTLVHEMYSLDKSSQEANENPKEFFHKSMNRNIFYSLIIYFFVLIGLKDFFLKLYKNRSFDFFDKFLIFNLISILYFVSIAGLWGQPRYFTPCLINISFFFAYGLNNILIKLKL
tara:strand:- start:1579 stop:3015 length:1437 start_codon:yes stop_codon:yes gene_type:complete